MISSAKFKATIWEYYRANRRELAWRNIQDPYRILVSEIMLQQTQVSRVESFYERFIKKFPNIVSLAKSNTSDVLRLWQGLGYNRRALALRQLAKTVVSEYGGDLPRDRDVLESLPGIGSYTAGAVRAFAFNEPDVFIETNIRRVFIHFFFPKRKKVHDDDIKKLVAKTLETKDPRNWYYALMDYGSMLGAEARAKNPNRRSAHYVKQSTFSGSDRQLRGQILKLLLARKKMMEDEICVILPQSRERIEKVIEALVAEKFAKRKGDCVVIA